MRSFVSATVAAVFSLSLIPAVAEAQSLGMPSDVEIQRKMDEQRKNAAEVLAPGNVAPVPKGVVKTEVPNIPATVVRPTDLDDLLKKYSQAKDRKPVGRPGEVDFMIFVSFSMPSEVLSELSQQAREAGAVLMLRGMKNNSLAETKEAARALNKAGVEWQIHPDAFKEFKVDKVPTFVVADASAQSILEDGCAPEMSYASVSGNISVDVALDTMRRRALPAGAKMADARLSRLQQSRKGNSIR